VVESVQKLQYLKTFYCKAASPLLATDIDNLLVLRPGLLPVVHLTSVLDELSTTHGIPSMITVFSVETAENPVPVNVT